MNRRESMAAVAGIGLGGAAAFAGAQTNRAAGDGPDELFLLWTSPEAEVAHRMVLMYTGYAKQTGLFRRIRLISWGPSQKLIAADRDIRSKIMELREAGVEVEACIACAESYGLVETLKAAGLPVIGQGKPLSMAMKDPSVCVLSV